MRVRRCTWIFVWAAAALLVSATASAQWQLATEDGKSTLKLGLLAQGQGEWIETPDAEHGTQNLFLRRLRVLMGGNFSEHWAYFVETDSPNLGKSKADGGKTADFFIQDAFVTYSSGDAFKLDFGMMLMPLSHHHVQSAATLLGVDYGAYTFVGSDPTASKIGRDYGVEARGYVLDKHLEYRVGMFQGYRGKDDAATGDIAGGNPFRGTARMVWYPFEAETGYFYTGTTLGAKKILAIGATYDRQSSYEGYGADLFYDQPVGSGSCFTVQADWSRLDGDDFLTSLPEQDIMLLELGFFHKSSRLGPYVQLSRRDYATEDAGHADEDKTQVGLAWWGNGHKLNVKLGAGRIEKDGAPDRDQVVLQLQLFYF